MVRSPSRIHVTTAKQPLAVTERKVWWNPEPLWTPQGKEKYHDPDGSG